MEVEVTNVFAKVFHSFEVDVGDVVVEDHLHLHLGRRALHLVLYI